MGKKRAIEIEKKQHDTVRDIRYTHTQKDRDKKECGVWEFKRIRERMKKRKKEPVKKE